MKYKIEDIKGISEAGIIKNISNVEYLIKINNTKKSVVVLSISSNGIEFLLDQEYHNIKYIENSTAKMKIVVDGIPITLNMHNNLNNIVYKNSGDLSPASMQTNLISQIPGKVVSINTKEGDKIKKGDTVCILESMKMQVSVRSHKDGIIKNIKIQKGFSVAKNYVIAEIE